MTTAVILGLNQSIFSSICPHVAWWIWVFFDVAIVELPIPWPRSTSNMDWQATTRLWLPKWFEGSTHVCWQHPPCLSFSITRVPSLDWNPVSAGYLLTYQVRLMMFFFTTSIHIHHYYISPMTFPWKKSYILNRFPYFKKNIGELYGTFCHDLPKSGDLPGHPSGGAALLADDPAGVAQGLQYMG
jgi:hypothetical protein